MKPTKYIKGMLVLDYSPYTNSYILYCEKTKKRYRFYVSATCEVPSETL